MLSKFIKKVIDNTYTNMSDKVTSFFMVTVSLLPGMWQIGCFFYGQDTVPGLISLAPLVEIHFSMQPMRPNA